MRRRKDTCSNMFESMQEHVGTDEVPSRDFQALPSGSTDWEDPVEVIEKVSDVNYLIRTDSRSEGIRIFHVIIL